MQLGGLRYGLAALLLSALPLEALQLDLPQNARQTAARDSALDQVQIPVGPFRDGGLETHEIEGDVKRRAYRLTSPGLTPLQILAPLREQVEAAGYELVLDCNQITCGGYDFRFAVEVLPAPNMNVNIRAFHFVSAIDPQSGAAITLLASASDGAAYLQIIQAGTVGQGAKQARPGVEDTVPASVQPEPPAETLAARLLENGSVVLHDIDFEVGTTTLDDVPSGALASLAALLEERPDLRIAVVGHTDTGGGLEVNITVSRARAQAVRERLIESYGADPGRVDAEGMGYLAPRASNLTPEGREANRRVEVILLSEGE